MKNPLSRLSDKIAPPKRGGITKAVKITAGTAAAIWVAMRLKRELYGPGGTKMSRYDKNVDEVWDRE
jgi:hypothetical protein